MVCQVWNTIGPMLEWLARYGVPLFGAVYGVLWLRRAHRTEHLKLHLKAAAEVQAVVTDLWRAAEAFHALPQDRRLSPFFENVWRDLAPRYRQAEAQAGLVLPARVFAKLKDIQRLMTVVHSHHNQLTAVTNRHAERAVMFGLDLPVPLAQDDTLPQDDLELLMHKTFTHWPERIINLCRDFQEELRALVHGGRKSLNWSQEVETLDRSREQRLGIKDLVALPAGRRITESLR